jgi:hypothetical protein
MIPKSSIIYGHRKINNFLKFLSMAISNVFLASMVDTVEPFPCVLALGDSTSAIGWLSNTSNSNLMSLTMQHTYS